MEDRVPPVDNRVRNHNMRLLGMPVKTAFLGPKPKMGLGFTKLSPFLAGGYLRRGLANGGARV